MSSCSRGATGSGSQSAAVGSDNSRLDTQALSVSPLVWWRAEGVAIPHHREVERVDQRIDLDRSVDGTFKHRVAMAATVSRTGEVLRMANAQLASHDADERISQARQSCPSSSKTATGSRRR